MTRKITPELFTAVKTLLSCGHTLQETANYLKLGQATVVRIKSAETLEEYFQQMAAIKAKEKAERKAKDKADQKPVPAPEAPKTTYPAPVVEHRQSITIQATHFMEQQQRKTNETLELISRKLTACMETMNLLLNCWKDN